MAKTTSCKRRLFIDLETYSDVDIKRGVFCYTESPNFEILLVAYAWDDGPVQLLSFDEVDLTETDPEEANPEWMRIRRALRQTQKSP